MKKFYLICFVLLIGIPNATDCASLRKVSKQHRVCESDQDCDIASWKVCDSEVSYPINKMFRSLYPKGDIREKRCRGDYPAALTRIESVYCDRPVRKARPGVCKARCIRRSDARPSK